MHFFVQIPVRVTIPTTANPSGSIKDDASTSEVQIPARAMIPATANVATINDDASTFEDHPNDVDPSSTSRKCNNTLDINRYYSKISTFLICIINTQQLKSLHLQIEDQEVGERKPTFNRYAL